MNISTLSTPTQMILAWVLLGALLTWLVIFATLAIHSHREEQKDWDELPTPAGAFPAVSTQVMHAQTTLAPVGLHTAAVNAEMPGSLDTASTFSFHSGRGMQQTRHSD
ncbi:MAG TPA: hypothetical protein VKR83_10665 [Ktedonobacteraceae bacterium]|nr:hypothetical protein [Ktedonobacteraceae bacterium]